MLTITDMLGPDHARELQFKQYQARKTLYEAWNQHTQDSAEYREALAAYDATVAELSAMLGDEADCGQVDCDLAALFSDLYKDNTGCRPRGHFTREQVTTYLANRSKDDQAGRE